MLSLQGARTVEGDALFLLRTVGPPATVDTEYVLELGAQHPLAIDDASRLGVSRMTMTVAVRPGELRLSIGDHEVVGLPPVDFAYGADGVELRIPADALLFRGADTYLERRAPSFPGDVNWDAVQWSLFDISGQYCWIDDVDSLCLD